MSVRMVDSAMPTTNLQVFETDGFVLDIVLLNSNQNLNLQYLGGTTSQYVDSSTSLFPDLKILGTAGTGYVFKICLTNLNSILSLCTQTDSFVVYPQGITIVENSWPKYMYEDETFPQISIRMIGSSQSSLRFFNTEAFEIEVSLLRHGIRRPTAFSSTPKLVFTGLQDVKFNNLRVFDELGSEYQLQFVLSINAAFLSSGTSSFVVTQRARSSMFDMIPRGVLVQDVSNFYCGRAFQVSVSLVTFANINLAPEDGFEVALALVASQDLSSAVSLQGATQRNITGASVTFDGLELLPSSPSCIGRYLLNYSLTCLYSGKTYGPYQSNVFQVLPYDISFDSTLPTNLLEGELLPSFAVRVQGANGDTLSGLTAADDTFGVVRVELYRDDLGSCAGYAASSSPVPLPNLQGRKERNLTSGQAEFTDLTILGIIGSCYVLVANYSVPNVASFVIRSTTFRLWPNALSSNLTNVCLFNNFPTIDCSLFALVDSQLPPVVVHPILKDMSGSWELEGIDQFYVDASLVTCQTRCKQSLSNASCVVDYYPPSPLSLSTSFAGNVIEKQLENPIFGVSAAEFDIKRISQNSSWPGHANCIAVNLRANVDLLGSQGASFTISGLTGVNVRSQTSVKLIDDLGNDMATWFQQASWKQGIGELALRLRADVTLAAGQELNFTFCVVNSHIAQQSPTILVEANGGAVIAPSPMDKAEGEMAPMRIDAARISVADIGQTSPWPGANNHILVTLVPNFDDIDGLLTLGGFPQPFLQSSFSLSGIIQEHVADFSSVLVNPQASSIEIGYKVLASGRRYVFSLPFTNIISPSSSPVISVQVASPRLQILPQALNPDHLAIDNLIGSLPGDAAPFFVQDTSVIAKSFTQSSSLPFPSTSTVSLRVAFNYKVSPRASFNVTGLDGILLLTNMTVSYRAPTNVNISSTAAIDMVEGKLTWQTEMEVDPGQEVIFQFSVENPKSRANRTIVFEVASDRYNSSLYLSSDVGRFLVEAPGFHLASITRNTTSAGMPVKISIALVPNIPLLSGSVLSITSSPAVFQLAQVCSADQDLFTVHLESEKVSVELLSNFSALQALEFALCATNDAQALASPSFLLEANLTTPGSCLGCYATIESIALDAINMQVDQPSFMIARISQTNPFPLGKNAMFITLVPNFLVNVNSTVTFTFALSLNETVSGLLSGLNLFGSDLFDSYQMDEADKSLSFVLTREVPAGEELLFAWNFTNPAETRNSTAVSVSCRHEGLVRVSFLQLQEDPAAIPGKVWSVGGDQLPFRVNPPAISYARAQQSTVYPGRPNEVTISFVLNVELPSGSELTLTGLDIACSGRKDVVVYESGGALVPFFASSCPANSSITCASYQCSSLSLLLQLSDSLSPGDLVAFSLTLQNPRSSSFLDSSYLDNMAELDCSPGGGHLTGSVSQQLSSSFLFDRLVVGGVVGFFAIEFDLMQQVVGAPVRTRGRSDQFLVAPAGIQLSPSQLETEYQTSPAVLTNSSLGNLPQFEVFCLDQLGHQLNVSSPGIRVVAHLLKSGQTMDEYLEGKLIQRLQGSAARFTDLRVAYLTGRNFSLSFSIELGGRAISASTSQFNILPSALRADSCPGDLLTGDSFQLSFHLVDQNGVVLSADDGSFSVEVDLLLNNVRSSQHLLGSRLALIKDNSISFSDLRIVNVSGTNFRFQFALAVDGQSMTSFLNSSWSSDCTSPFSVFPSSLRLLPQSDCINSFESGQELSPSSLRIFDVRGDAIEQVSDSSFALVR
eukprot:758902-Hanusia_phi.AAC.1